MAETSVQGSIHSGFRKRHPHRHGNLPNPQQKSKTCDLLTGQRFQEKKSGRGVLRAKKHTTRLTLIRRHQLRLPADLLATGRDRKSTRLNSSHVRISYAVFCLKKKKTQ